MCISELYGTGGIDNSKKLNRFTISVDDDTACFIQKVADELSLSNSEVINRLISPTIKKIKLQEGLMIEKPLIVAFDWITKG